MNNNNKSKSMWNKNSYDGETWTKERMQKVIQMNSHISWATIVDRTPKQQPYPSTINAVQEVSTQHTLSTLTINTSEQKGKKKKDKVNDYIKSWEKRSKPAPSTTKLTNSKSSLESTKISKEPNPTNPLSNKRHISSTNDIYQSLTSNKRQHRTSLTLKKRLPVFTNFCIQKQNKLQQKGLQIFGFKYTSKNQTQSTKRQQTNSIQTSTHNTTKLTENTYKGDTLTKLNSSHIRLFYIHINGTDSGRGDHTLIQLCQYLKEMGVDFIGLTEINVHWKIHHVINNFNNILNDTW